MKYIMGYIAGSADGLIGHDQSSISIPLLDSDFVMQNDLIATAE